MRTVTEYFAVHLPKPEDEAPLLDDGTEENHDVY
jgi:hypothetical protein